MSTREQLNSYIQQLERRLRLGAILRGAAILASAALATTVVLVLIINLLAFSHGSVISARTLLFLGLAAAACLGLLFPLRQLNRRHAARTAENSFPEFQQRLVTFAERDETRRDAFHRSAGRRHAGSRSQSRARATASRIKTLLISLGAGLASLAVLVWMIFAGPGYLGYGATCFGPVSTRASLPCMTSALHPAMLPSAAIPTSSSPPCPSASRRTKFASTPATRAPRSGNRSPCSRSRTALASSFSSRAFPRTSNTTSKPARCIRAISTSA